MMIYDFCDRKLNHINTGLFGAFSGGGGGNSELIRARKMKLGCLV